MEIHELVVGELQTNCYIVTSELNHAVVVDPGDEAEKILEKVRELGVKVKYILLTHGHFDHINAADAVKKAFPEAKIVVMAEDKDLCDNPTLVSPRVSGGTDPDLLFADGDKVKLDELDFVYMATPGHTKGSAIILCGDKLFTGDTLMSRGCGRTDLFGGSTKAMRQSLKKIGELPGEDYEIFPGHGPGTCMRIERYANPYLRKAMGLGL